MYLVCGAGAGAGAGIAPEAGARCSYLRARLGILGCGACMSSDTVWTTAGTPHNAFSILFGASLYILYLSFLAGALQACLV